MIPALYMLLEIEMPRDLVFGNSQILVNLDRHLSIRDLYYPYVGWANHVGGHRCRVGVWVEHIGFAWLNDEWEWQLKYEADSLVSNCTARHHGLGIRLRVAHAVGVHANVLMQRFRVENLRMEERRVRIFTGYDLRIDESDIGDTAFYNPFLESVIHYKRDRWFAYSGLHANTNTGIWQYACGEKGFRGAEGTWRDAEDGELSMNAIAQGSVDSVASYDLLLPPLETRELHTWLVMGASVGEVGDLRNQIVERGPESYIDVCLTAWRGRFHRTADFLSLPACVSELYFRSVLVIATQTDRGGAIMASNDSDIMETARAHYSYMWPRDGALVASALVGIGEMNIPRAFFEFCARVLPKDRSALLHKYGPDGTIGASWHPWVLNDGSAEIPFQEDGTALVIWAAWQYYQKSHDIKFAREFYNEFVKPTAQFIRDYRYPDSNLPMASWDLWEERRGTHIFTTAAVCAALMSASSFANLFGDTELGTSFSEAACEVRDAIVKCFWSDDKGHFARMITVDDSGARAVDSTADASAYAVFGFGVLDADHPMVVATMQSLGKKLWVRSGAGGMARYERDYYFRTTDDFDNVPGNPWIICTLWLADWYIAIAKSEAEMRGALDLIEWAALRATATGILSEQIHPQTLQPLSVAPLTWSHAQFITTVTRYLAKLNELGAVL